MDYLSKILNSSMLPYIRLQGKFVSASTGSNSKKIARCTSIEMTFRPESAKPSRRVRSRSKRSRRMIQMRVVAVTVMNQEKI